MNEEIYPRFTDDEPLVNITASVNMNGEMCPEFTDDKPLANTTASVNIEIEEYLDFLSFALYFAEMKTSLSRQEVNSHFLDFFISKKDSYSNSESYKDDYRPFSILPIFSGLVFVNTEFALEYDRLENKDIKENGSPIGNGWAAEYHWKTPIIAYKYENIIEVFTNPESYALLRNTAIPYFKVKSTLLKSNADKKIETADEKIKNIREALDHLDKNPSIIKYR